MEDKKQLYKALINALLLSSIPWVVQLINVVFELHIQRFGLHPHEWKGLAGILTMPFIHGDWMHLISNTPPLFLLTFGLFIFYEKKSWEILLSLYLFGGLLTWLMGRVDSVHIGASGLVYALAAFHFVSGIIRKVPRQLAFSMLVVFLYGGFIWAFFPTLYQGTMISWEGHLSGSLAGITFAFYYRRLGPEPPVYPYLEKDEENDSDEDDYWKLPEQKQQDKNDNAEKRGNEER
jgi:membrane associated rhomboid family serine protease